MYPVSEGFIAAMGREAVQHIRGVLTDVTRGETEITDKLCGDIRTESQCMDTTQFGFGGMYVGTLECSLDLPYSMKDELKGGTVYLEFGVETSGGIEWIPLGIWNITECTRDSADRIKLSGMDNLSRLLTDTETKLRSYVGVVHIETLMKHVTSLTGVEFAQTIEELEELSGRQLRSGIWATGYGATAWAEVKSIAQILGSFAFANREGRIEFRRLDNTNPVITVTADRRHSAQLEEYTYRVRGVKYTDTQGYTVQSDISGADPYGGVPGFSDCILVWETDGDFRDPQYRIYLDKIAPYLKNVEFTPGTVDYYGNPALDVGDYVTVSGGAAQHSGDVPFLICSSSWQFRGPQTLTAYGFSETGTEDISSTSKETEQIRTVNITKSIVTVELLDYPGELFGVERTAAKGGFSCRAQTCCFLEFSAALVGEETGNIEISVYFDGVVQTFRPIFTVREGEYAAQHFTLPLSSTADTHTVEITALGECSLEQISAYVWGQNITEVCPEPTGEEDYIYTVSGSTAKVVGYIGESLSPEIPEKLGGAAVTKLGALAFTYSDVEYVYIPDGVTEIE